MKFVLSEKEKEIENFINKYLRRNNLVFLLFKLVVYENEYLKFEELEVVLIVEEMNVDVLEVIDNIFSEVEKVIEINILLLVGKLKIVSRKVNNRVIYVE